MRGLEVAPRIERIFTGDLLEAKSRPFNVAVAGCSTGQEVWSYALLCASNQFSDFKVDGYDLYEERLKVGRKGVYPAIWNYQQLFVEDKRIAPGLISVVQGTDTREMRFADSVRARVGFRQHDFSISPFPVPYDLIIATNVLYQKQEGGKKNALLNLLRSLKQGGILVHNDSDALMLPEDSDLVGRVNAPLMKELGLRV